MWQEKYFKSAAELAKWIEANRHKIQFDELAINNGWGVVFRPLIKVY